MKRSMSFSIHRQIIIGLTSHRVEMLTLLADFIEKSDLVVLEEAKDESFPKMLSGEISVEQYVSDSYLDFPLFAQKFYLLLRDFYSRGKRIIQIEPYYERLFQIHELFLRGKTPEDIRANEDLKHVYEIESEVSKRLIEYYEASVSKTFGEIVQAVKDFAKADAERFRLRDSMRAEGIHRYISENISTENKIYRIFIEAGGIHLYLIKCLKEIIPSEYRIESVSTMELLSRKMNKTYPRAPGDELTLKYLFGEEIDEEMEDLLSARSLIYVSLLSKGEMCPTQENIAPHTLEEIEAINFVNALSFNQCKDLFYKIRN